MLGIKFPNIGRQRLTIQSHPPTDQKVKGSNPFGCASLWSMIRGEWWDFGFLVEFRSLFIACYLCGDGYAHGYEWFLFDLSPQEGEGVVGVS
jgi:hypothetical protein